MNSKLLLTSILILVTLQSYAQWSTTGGMNAAANTTGGRVGIGTGSPSSKLHVVDGTGVLRTSDNTDGIILSSYRNTKSIGLSAADGGFYGGSGSSGFKLINGELQFLTNGNFVTIIKNNGNVGVGTTSPSAWFPGKVLEIKDSRPILKLNASSSSLGTIVFTNEAVNATTHTGEFHVNHFYNSNQPDKSIIAFGGYPSGDVLVVAADGKVGVGTKILDAKLTVAGNVHAREVKVAINAGADFVFSKDYTLRSLKETEEFIKSNQHLPEIASAVEMESSGVHLGEMNIKLLQKIEELTLYAIDQEKRLVKQEEELNLSNEKNKVLLDYLKKMEERVEALESVNASGEK